MKKIKKIIAICIILIIVFANCMNFSYAKNEINIYSRSYISYERNTKTVLLGKKINDKVPMASTTKIMTAILLLEYGKLDEYAIASKKAQSITGQQLNLKDGDKISLNDLLYAIMLYSANDGAHVVAEHIGGSVEEFCKMMNKKAKEIGCINTNFTSPHGLDNPNHYSTPYDLALITDYALNIPKFKQVTSTKNYTIKINENSREIRNTNRLVHEDNDITGTKTGYTNNALYCLVANKKYADKDIIVVLLGANTSNQRFDETRKLLNYSLENYEIVDIRKYLKEFIEVDIIKGKERTYRIVPNEIKDICIKKSDKENIDVKYYVLENINAPLTKNKVLGVADVLINNNSVLKIEYIISNHVEKKTNIDYFCYILNNLYTYMKIT